MITGEKVIIRSILKSDEKDIFEWVNREELRRMTGTLYPISEYEHEEWIRTIATSSKKKLFVILIKENLEKIGTIGLKNFDDVNKNVELYISIGSNLPDHIGKGYGTDAIRTLVRYCFDNLNIHRVYLHVFETNKRAIKAYENAGFIKEGVLREHHFNNGRYEDVIVMGITSTI